MLIGEDGDLAVDDGQHDGLAHELCLVGILRGDRDARVAEHGFGTRGGDLDVGHAVNRLGERVAQVPEVTRLVVVLGLVVGNRGAAARTPVDDALAAVDQAVVVPVAEDLAHGLGVLGAHGEFLVVEVDGAAHALDLLDDDAAVLAAPVLAGLEELLAADLEARDALALELLVDLGLRGDARMVGAEDPARGIAAHAHVAHEGILDGIVHGMAHMQNAGHVGRRDDDGAVADALGALVGSGVHPTVDKLGLEDLGVVGLGHLFHAMLLASVKYAT